MPDLNSIDGGKNLRHAAPPMANSSSHPASGMAACGWRRVRIPRNCAVTQGVAYAGDVPKGGDGVITLTAPDGVWQDLLAARPPRLRNDVANLMMAGDMAVDADPVRFAQYYPAVMRAVELLRPARPAPRAAPVSPSAAGSYDSPIGRYIHLDLEGPGLPGVFRGSGIGHSAAAATYRGLPRVAVAPRVRMQKK